MKHPVRIEPSNSKLISLTFTHVRRPDISLVVTQGSKYRSTHFSSSSSSSSRSSSSSVTDTDTNLFQ